MPASGNGISVVICCYNSSARLPRTLEHLARQALPGKLPLEVIVVDNNSTDGTREVALWEWKKLQNPFPLMVVEQPVQGLTHAREKGIGAASYDIILLCDDDNWLCPDYAEKVFRIMSSDPRVGVLGGRGEAVTDGVFPSWFSSFQSAYAVGAQNLESGDVSKRGYLWGAGMALRKSVVQRFWQLGFSSLLTDRKGNELSSGGDSELCKWFLLAGYKLWYEESLVFQHYIPSERLTIPYFRKMQQGHDRSFRVLKKYDMLLSATTATTWFRAKKLSSHLMGLLKALLFLNSRGIKKNLVNLSLFSPLESLVFDSDIKKIRSMIRLAKNALANP